MPMRTDCRHYESRTYASGEVVRKCRLDLAPEAPWRCPADCVGFEKRRFDAGWQYGSLQPAPQPAEVTASGEDVAALLDAAEDIVNSAAPEIIAEVEGTKKGLFRRRPSGKGKKRRKR